MKSAPITLSVIRLAWVIASILCINGLAVGVDESKSPILTFPVNRDPVAVDNAFAQLNPFYKQRAGSFYDTKYVSFSAAQLFELARIRPEQMPGTLDSLRAFVFDYLDCYVRGDGRISADHQSECVAQMNGRFKALLDDFQYKVYEIWRDDTSGRVNTLHFLIQSTPQPVPDSDPVEQPK